MDRARHTRRHIDPMGRRNDSGPCVRSTKGRRCADGCEKDSRHALRSEASCWGNPTAVPGAHPDPPSDFHSRTLPIATHGGSLFRSHLHSVAPLYFGRTGRNRFDDPLGRYGVLYAARDPFGAFIETFGQETGSRTVGVGELKMRCLTEFYPVTPLSLVDLF